MGGSDQLDGATIAKWKLTHDHPDGGLAVYTLPKGNFTNFYWRLRIPGPAWTKAAGGDTLKMEIEVVDDEPHLIFTATANFLPRGSHRAMYDVGPLSKDGVQLETDKPLKFIFGYHVDANGNNSQPTTCHYRLEGSWTFHPLFEKQ